MTQFTADEVRSFLAECVTIVKPGEWLVVRVTDLTPSQMREYQLIMNEQHDAGWLPFRVLIVHGNELGIAPGGPA